MKLNKAMVKAVSEYAVALNEYNDAIEIFANLPCTKHSIRVHDAHVKTAEFQAELMKVLDNEEEALNSMIFLGNTISEVLRVFAGRGDGD